ncbi:MAG: RnfABCDGE type electron transport complex subunit D [Clostridia bacterium]|nr:RnfABCDGE type electron transport complex subunit D [Clostridia bacterium]
MVNGKKLYVSASPHLRSTVTTRRIMLDVILALVPALIASAVLFGPRTLMVTAVSVATAILSEFAARKIMKRNMTIGDLSAIVTGMLVAFNLPATIPLWIAAVGSFFAIVVVKQFFGGIGQNFANPAIVARIVLLLSFGAQMTNWVEPFSWKTTPVTGATPLAQLAAGETPSASLLQMFLGEHGGCLGETCAAALLLGGLYLLMRRVISPIIPCSYIGTVAVLMLIKGHGDLQFVAYELLSGGLLLGAIFMATDYSTSPLNSKARLIFGIGCGLLTCLMRLFASMAEGVSFAILIMNLLVPYLERMTAPKPFGTPKKEKKEKKEAAQA